MKPAVLPPNEAQRLQALRDLHALDTPPEAAMSLFETLSPALRGMQNPDAFDRLRSHAANLAFDAVLSIVVTLSAAANTPDGQSSEC